jgi:hypothetical protein
MRHVRHRGEISDDTDAVSTVSNPDIGTTHGLTVPFLRRAKGIIGTGVVITYTLNQHLSVHLKEIYIYAPIIVNASMVLRFSDVLLEQVVSSWVGPSIMSPSTSASPSDPSSTGSSLEPPTGQLAPTPQ